DGRRLFDIRQPRARLARCQAADGRVQSGLCAWSRHHRHDDQMGVVKDTMSTFRPRLEYGIAGRAKPGELLSGDRSAVRDLSDGVLLAVADGLGHGPEAAGAATVAVAALDTWLGHPVSRLMEQCHAALVGTRGVVLALAALDARHATLTWLAVGNVEGRLIHRTADGRREGQSLRMHSGILGHRLPKLHPTTIAIQLGD